MQAMNFWYPTSISQITEINESFDSCMLRVCYAGKNRNMSILTEAAIENAIPTMSYCPIVANYNVDEDTIGGHDVRVMKDGDGELKMVNLTDAIGVIPENPQWNWETVTEDDGTEHKYLCTPAILWKRTPVYEKLKSEGVSGQSMEISVENGRVVDGLFEIDAFSFTAFCLLGDGIEPCFESAQVSMFGLDKTAERFGDMMEDFKRQFSVIAASADDDKTPNGDDSFTKGGEDSLNISELMEKYGLTEKDIDFEADGMSAEDIEARFAELARKFDDEDGDEEGDKEGDKEGDEEGDEEVPLDDNDDAPGGSKQQSYQLTGEQMADGVRKALDTVTYTDEWGEWNRYSYVDYDQQAGEIYVIDMTDFNLYGLSFVMDGDNVSVDFDHPKRKKVAFVDFDMGDEQFSYASIMDVANARFAKVAETVEGLRQYKQDVEAAERNAKLEALFSSFADLDGDDRFSELKASCEAMDLKDIEDKCFAIRGRKVQMKFSQEPTKGIRLPVEHKHDDADEPYGGVFREYGIG